MPAAQGGRAAGGRAPGRGLAGAAAVPVPVARGLVAWLVTAGLDGVLGRLVIPVASRVIAPIRPGLRARTPGRPDGTVPRGQSKALTVATVASAVIPNSA